MRYVPLASLPIDNNFATPTTVKQPKPTVDAIMSTEGLSKAEQKAEKQKNAQSAAIERSKKRAAIVTKFCNDYKVDSKSELVKYIKQILKNPATKNVPTSEYKKQLETIGNSISVIGIDSLTLIVGANAAKKYQYLIYDNQLKDYKSAQNIVKAKENISDLKGNANSKTSKLSDFDGYRYMLDNQDDDDELRQLVKNTFGIDV